MERRNSRFLIDKIDSRLGSVDKELKFDKIIILVGLLIIVCASIFLGIAVNSHPMLAIFSVLLLIFGVFLTYTMVKEYINDSIKQHRQSGAGTTPKL